MKEKAFFSRFQAWSACLGNLFEHYDAALFGFLSSLLASYIFPDKEPLTALILVYAMIPLGMMARPIGALLFGYIGDAYGRKPALFLTLGGMALVSGALALTKSYLHGGLLIPMAFVTGRILQNFFAAGETIGGAIYLLENTEEKKHDLLSGIYNSTTIGGILLAAAGVALLVYFDTLPQSWHYLYAFGCITALFGCFVRHKNGGGVEPIKKTGVLSFVGVFWHYRRALLWIMVTAGFSYANYSISLILINGFVPLVSPVTTEEMMKMNIPLLLLDFCALPFFGWLSSKVSREKLLLSSAMIALVCALPLFMMLKGASLMSVIAIRVALVLIGVAFAAPFHAWVIQLIPSTHRYTVISLGYALGSQLIGGPTAAFSLWLYKQTHIVSSIAWYWALLSLAATAVMIQAYRKERRSPPINSKMFLLMSRFYIF